MKKEDETYDSFIEFKYPCAEPGLEEIGYSPAGPWRKNYGAECNEDGEYFQVILTSGAGFVRMGHELDWGIDSSDSYIEYYRIVVPTPKRETSLHAPGAKDDKGKPDVARVLEGFRNAIYQISVVGDAGAGKYTWKGFLDVPDGFNRYSAAMLRHFLNEGEDHLALDTDPLLVEHSKGEICHAAQTAWNAMARLELLMRTKEAAKLSKEGNS